MPDIKLDLVDSSSNDRGQTRSRSQITFRITREEDLKAGREAIVNARRITQVKLSETTEGTLDEKIARKCASRSWATIDSKFATFVKIVDATAKVNKADYMCYNSSIEHLHLIDTSLCGSRMASDIFSLQGAPYTTFARVSVEKSAQIIQEQLDRDQAIIDLLDTMELAFAFVDVVETLREKIALLDDTIQNILRQTFECALFIREYAKHGFRGGFWTLNNCVSPNCHLKGESIINCCQILMKQSKSFV
jgi:hypothetical protein